MLSIKMISASVRTTIRQFVCNRNISRSCPRTSAEMDQIQEKFLEEKCILVDENDKVTGYATKRDCHLVKNNELLLHRAFSAFIFNKRGDLLLTKRSKEKITYPEVYSNSCCSHPLADFPEEEEEKDAIGVKRAAQRRINYELGIPIENLPLEEINYITRLHYKDLGNGKWGEHEITYILFVRGDLTVNPNSNELSEISYVPRNGLDEYIKTLDSEVSPWFKLILKHRLRYWWDNLDNLDAIRDHKNIFRFRNQQS